MNLPDTLPLSPAQYESLLASQDWATLSKRLTEFAYRKIHKRSWEEAEDIAQTAIRRAFDPKSRRWNPKAQPNVFWFLGNVAQGVIANRRRQLKSGRVETLYEHEGLDQLAPEAIDATDEVLARRHRAALIVRELARQVATDRACVLVLGAFQAETDDPREQSASTGLGMQAVYNARSKLRATVTQIAQTFDQGSDMSTLQ
jgi:DNA-directed RNA polymerase specialized sigma24 family protein